jgi:hypothetical protein
MNPYKIHAGIKVPPPSRPTTATTVSRAAATMLALDVGDSFLVRDPLDAVKAEKSMRDMNGNERKKKRGRKYVSRRLPKGLRIWRVQ